MYDRAHDRTGSYLIVHGDCVSIGCYAMTDDVREEIYTLAAAALNTGQPLFRVHVFPLRMTRPNIEFHRGNQWDAFRRNLKVGHDWFEQHRRPPNVESRDGKYVILCELVDSRSDVVTPHVSSRWHGSTLVCQH